VLSQPPDNARLVTIFLLLLSIKHSQIISNNWKAASKTDQ